MMDQQTDSQQNQNQITKVVYTTSATFGDRQMAEMVYQPEEKQTGFVYWDGGDWTYYKDLELKDGRKCVPYSPFNNLIKNDVILFPSQPEEYGTEESLLKDIETYIHRYVDVSPLYEKIASYYVLLSWIYEGFNELPYLRLRGEPGQGKTRFLQVVGSLCYKPIFASGASSTSPLFRLLDSIRGTLIIDESDFRMSDEKAELVKILNNGNVKGFPVLRSEVLANAKEFNPKAYQVFGPKLLASRGFFQDRALESRFLTEEMGHHKLRKDIPINLPDAYKTESLQLRNKLLLYRFRNVNVRIANPELVDPTIEPRLNQMFVPLLSVINDPIDREKLHQLARTSNQQMVGERGLDVEAQVLEVIRNLTTPEHTPTIKDITESFSQQYGQEYERRVTPKWIGNILRTKLGLKSYKSHGVYVLLPTEKPKLERLYERYGMTPAEQKEEVPVFQSSPPTPQTNLPLED